MKRSLLLLASLAVLLSGCAGGWRHGPPAGYAGPGTPATLVPGGAPEAAAAAPAVAATPAARPAGAAKAAGAGTAETKDGVRFVWTGGGGSVAVAGEFNAWSPTADAMQKQADGSFALLKPLAPGRYAYKFVVDGTNWKEDPTAAEFVDDGFGGKNSVIVVTGAAAAAPPATAPAAAKPAAGAGPRETADGVRFVWTGGGGTVNLAGEFNGWSTSEDPLAKQADGSFAILKKLAPGRYAYKFVVDGTSWKEDPTAAEFVDDGFGGKNSVIVVAGAAGGGAPQTVSAPAAPAAPAPVTGKAKPPAAGPDGVTFTFAQPATSVHLAGDFNGWSTTTDPLTRQADGTWTITKKLPAGTHAYRFVVNGTTWKLDDANPDSRDDGFGGKNSIVTVK